MSPLSRSCPVAMTPTFDTGTSEPVSGECAGQEDKWWETLCQSRWEEVQTPCQGPVGTGRKQPARSDQAWTPHLGQFWPRGLGDCSHQDLIRALGAVRVPSLSIPSQPFYLSKALQVL